MELFGIDVSQYQGNIDWNQVKDAGVKFAFIRGGYGKNNIDPYFHQNAKGATAVGIPIGIYWFSYALNTEMAANEAKYALDLARQYNVTWPIAYDLEGDSVSYADRQGVTITKQLATDMAKAFCQTVEQAGYTPINYTNLSYYYNYFDRSQIPYDIWYAQYSSTRSIDDMSIWQYSSSGSVAGIPGRCDVNIAYKDYGDTTTELEDSNNEVEVEEMQCFFKVDNGDTVWWFDGQQIHRLAHRDERNVLNDIYKANNGKDMPFFDWKSSAPWYNRLQNAINRVVDITVDKPASVEE